VRDAQDRKQNEFHRDIHTYVNGALFSKRDLLTGFFYSDLPIRTHAARMVRRYGELISGNSGTPVSDTAVHVEPYRGDVAEVSEISKELEAIEEHILLACVHGSLGTYETVPYSDFDALVILRNSAFDNASTLARVVQVLVKSQRQMFHFDPLQHHGWFVLTEYDLKVFCEAYFPSILFNYAKSISSRETIELVLQKRQSTFELKQAFARLKRSIQQTDVDVVQTSLYQFKSLLSKIMLIPAFYLQALAGEGVFKKESYIRIYQHFSSRDLYAIEQATKIRRNWSQVLGDLDSYFYSRKPVHRKLTTRYIRIQPPRELAHFFDARSLLSLTKLLGKMQVNLA